MGLTILNGRSRFDLAICVIKRVKARPLDRDLTLWMRLIACDLDRYNADFKTRVLMISGGPLVHAMEACDAATSRLIRPL